VAGPDAALLSLAESVADGSPVDWAAAEREAQPGDQEVVRQLRVLAELAVLHRSLPAMAGTGPPRGSAVRSTTAPAIGAWAHLALLERLGRGTFGEVYRAWDRHLERDVALKLLHGVHGTDEAPSLSRDTSDAAADPHVAAILREARLLARMRHANVVHVYGVAVHEGRVGLWMELIRGETLEQLLARNGPFNAREAALIGIDLCRALAAIHGAGLIHRDVKAQNVMRETGGRIVLMDLGTGRPSGPRMLPDLAGTPLYLAPEIFAGAAASQRTDVYSLGVLLYHLVTGSFPVSASSVAELEQRHAAGAGVRLRDARADLATEFVSVVERTLANPDQRYATAGALESALVATLEDGPAVLQDPAAPPTPQSRWLRWRTGVAAAAVAVTVALGGFAWTALRGGWSASTPLESIAVLPLANLSNDPAQEYFADGMTDELIATLGRLDGVNVISRTSVMRYKRSTAPLPEIAKTLGVDVILEGSILTMPASNSPGGGRRIRINARLIDAATDTQLWNRTFERSGDDVLALQSEVARAVSEGIHVRVARAAVVGSRPQDFQVFDLYLRGRYYWNMRTEEGLTQSVRYFQAAIDRDPRYAPAHAGLADAYSMLGYYSFLSSDDAITRARAAALTALALDDSLGEVHASLAAIHVRLFEWDAAETSFRRAIELTPRYATAHHWYALCLAVQRRFDEAFYHIETASALDPLSASLRGAHGIVLLWAGRYDEAISHIRAALALEPGLARLRSSLARALALRGDYGMALAEAKRAVSLAPHNAEILADLAAVFAISGRRSEAARIAQDLATRYLRGEHGEPIAVAAVYAALGDNDGAFEWLDRARQRRDPWLGEFTVEVRFDNLRKDPRFADLLRDIGLPP
jgi:serine/threonine protein kinase/Flp pilus assembly protein TadD